MARAEQFRKPRAPEPQRAHSMGAKLAQVLLCTHQVGVLLRYSVDIGKDRCLNLPAEHVRLVLLGVPTLPELQTRACRSEDERPASRWPVQGRGERSPKGRAPAWWDEGGTTNRCKPGQNIVRGHRVRFDWVLCSEAM